MAFCFTWGWVGAVVKVLVVWQVLVLGSDKSFLFANQNEDQTIRLNKKQQGPKLMWEVWSMLSWHLCNAK